MRQPTVTIKRTTWRANAHDNYVVTAPGKILANHFSGPTARIDAINYVYRHFDYPNIVWPTGRTA